MVDEATRRRLDRLIDDHFAFEAADDVDGVLGTFVEDAEHEVIGGPYGRLRGKPALRRFYETLFKEIEGEGVEPLGRLYGDDFVVDEAVWIGQVRDGRAFKLDGKQGHVRMRILHVFRLRDGLIARESFWFDQDDLARQLV